MSVSRFWSAIFRLGFVDFGWSDSLPDRGWMQDLVSCLSRGRMVVEYVILLAGFVHRWVLLEEVEVGCSCGRRKGGIFDRLRGMWNIGGRPRMRIGLDIRCEKKNQWITLASQN